MGLLDKFTQQMQQKIRAAFSNDGKIDEKEARELGLSKEKAKLLMRELAGDGSGILSSDSVEITAQNSWVGSPSRDTHQDETAIQAQGYTAITDRMSIPLGDGYEFQVKMYYNENTDNYRYIVGMYKDGSRMDGTGFENEQKLDNYLLTKYGVNYAKLKVGNYLNFNKDTLEFSLNISPVDSKKDVTIDAVEGGFEIPEGENFQKTNRRFAVAMIRDMYNSVIKENLDAVKSLGALDMGFWREALGMGVQAVADLVEGQELITATTLKRVDRMVQERDKVCGVLEQLVDNPSEFSDKFSQLVGKAYSDMNFQKLRDICHNGKTPNEEFELRHTKCMEEFDKMYSDNKITNYLEGNTGAKIFGSISQKADAVADIIAMFWATGGIGALWGKAGQKTAQMLSKEILKDAAKGNYKNVVAKFSKLTGSVKQRVVQLAENNPKLAEYMSRAANSKFGKYSALASANFVKGAPTSVATMSTWEGMKTFLNCITNAEELPMSEILEQTWESIKGGAEMGVEMTGLQAFAINPIMTSKLMSKALSKMTGASKQAKKLVSESGETGVSMQEISKIYEECALTRRGVFVNEGAHLTVTIGTMVPAFATLDTAFGYDEESYKQQLLQTASSQQERDEISKMSSAELRTKFFIDNLEAQAEGMTTIEGVSLAMRRWQAARLAGHKMKRKQINIVDANLRSRTEDGKTFYELTGADGKVLKLKEGKRVVSKFSSIASATAAYNTLCMQVFANLNAENELEEVVVTGVNGVNEGAEATSSFAQREKVSVRTDEGAGINDRTVGKSTPDRGINRIQNNNPNLNDKGQYGLAKETTASLEDTLKACNKKFEEQLKEGETVYSLSEVERIKLLFAKNPKVVVDVLKQQAEWKSWLDKSEHYSVELIEKMIELSEKTPDLYSMLLSRNGNLEWWFKYNNISEFEKSYTKNPELFKDLFNRKDLKGENLFFSSDIALILDNIDKDSKIRDFVSAKIKNGNQDTYAFSGNMIASYINGKLGQKELLLMSLKSLDGKYNLLSQEQIDDVKYYLDDSSNIVSDLKNPETSHQARCQILLKTDENIRDILYNVPELEAFLIKNIPNDTYSLKLNPNSAEGTISFTCTSDNKSTTLRFKTIESGSFEVISREFSEQNGNISNIRTEFADGRIMTEKIEYETLVMGTESQKVAINKTKMLYEREGEPIYKETYTASDEVEGAFDIHVQERGLSTSVAGTAKKYGTKSPAAKVTRNLVSPSGMQTVSTIVQGPKGGKSSYVIKDKAGKTVINIERTNRQISENHYKSTLNGQTYEMLFEDNNIKVSKTNKNGKTETVKLGADVLDPQLRDLYKQLPGDFLFIIAKTGLKVVLSDVPGGSQYNAYEKTIYIAKQHANNPFVFAHELGHAIDNLLMNDFCNDENLGKIFQQDVAIYKNQASIEGNRIVDYFTDIHTDLLTEPNDHIKEVIAETFALSSGLINNDHSIAMRGVELQHKFMPTQADILVNVYDCVENVGKKIAGQVSPDNNTSGMAMSTILPLPSTRLINHAKQTIQRWFGREKETVGQVSPDKGVTGGKLGETKQTPYISAGNKVFDIKPEDFAKNPAKIKEVQASIDELRKTEPHRADELQIVFDMFKNPTKDYEVSDAQLNAVARFIHEQYAAAKDELNSTVKFNELDSDGTFSSRIKSEASLKVKLENYLKDAIKDRKKDPENPIKTLYDAYIDVRDAYACRTEFKSAAKGTYTDTAKIQTLKNEISQLEQQNADKKTIALKKQELERRENIIKLVNEAKQLRAEGKTELAESKMLDASRIAAEIQSQPYVEKIKAMLDRIKEEYGDVEVLRLTNYTSKDGISILSRDQLCEIKQYGAEKGVKVDFIKLASDIYPDATSEFVKGSSTKQQPTGYMAIQVNFRTKSGKVFEHQFRGQLTGKLAESEHPLYDLRTGKCPWKLHPELEGLYKPIGELIDESVMPEGAYKNHQRYLMDYNTHLRKLELGFESEAPRMEDYELYIDKKGVEKRFKFDKRLSAENLMKLDDVAKEVTAKRIVPKKAVAEFYKRIGAKELEDGMLDINLDNSPISHAAPKVENRDVPSDINIENLAADKGFNTVQRAHIQEALNEVPEKFFAFNKMCKLEGLSCEDIVRLLTSQKVTLTDLELIEEYAKTAKEYGFNLVEMMESTESGFNEYVQTETQRLTLGFAKPAKPQTTVRVTDDWKDLVSQVLKLQTVHRGADGFEKLSKEETKRASQIASVFNIDNIDSYEIGKLAKTIKDEDVEIAQAYAKAFKYIRADFVTDIIDKIDGSQVKREFALEMLKLNQQFDALRKQYPDFNRRIRNFLQGAEWLDSLAKIETKEQSDAYLKYINTTLLKDLYHAPDVNLIKTPEDVEGYKQIEHAVRYDFKEVFMSLPPELRELFNDDLIQSTHDYNQARDVKEIIEFMKNSEHKDAVIEFMQNNKSSDSSTILYKWHMIVDNNGEFLPETLRRINAMDECAIDHNETKYRDAIEHHSSENYYWMDKETFDSVINILKDENIKSKLGRSLSMEEAEAYHYLKDWQKDFVLLKLNQNTSESGLKMYIKLAKYTEIPEQSTLSEILLKNSGEDYYIDSVVFSKSHNNYVSYSNLYKLLKTKEDIAAFERLVKKLPFEDYRKGYFYEQLVERGDNSFAAKLDLVEKCPTLEKLLGYEGRYSFDILFNKVKNEYQAEFLTQLEYLVSQKPEYAEKINDVLKADEWAGTPPPIETITSKEIVETVKKNIETILGMDKTFADIIPKENLSSGEFGLSEVLLSNNLSKEKYNYIMDVAKKDPEMQCINNPDYRDGHSLRDAKQYIVKIVSNDIDLQTLKSVAAKTQDVQNISKIISCVNQYNKNLFEIMIKDDLFETNDFENILKRRRRIEIEQYKEDIAAKIEFYNKFRNDSNLDKQNFKWLMEQVREYQKGVVSVVAANKEIPQKLKQDIVRNICPENVDMAKLYCSDYKRLEIDVNQIPILLENYETISYKQLNKLNRKMGREAVAKLSDTDVVVAAQFVDILDVQNINEIPAAGKKSLLRSLVDSKAGTFNISDKLKERFPLLPRTQEEYCSLLPTIVRSLGIETTPLTPEQRIQMFNKSTANLSLSLAKMSDSEYASMKVSQEYSREDFINTVLEKTKGLTELECRKVYDYYGFELHHNKHNETGFTITGYPVNLNNGAKLAQIESPATRAVVESLRADVVRFSTQNKIHCDNPIVEKYLNEVAEALPEIRSMIGRVQHGNDGTKGAHDFDVMKHSLKVMQKITQDPKFEQLNESDKKIMMLASLLHDITKSEGRSDSTHAREGSFDAYYIAKKFKLTKDEEIKLYTLIKHHEWLNFVNSKHVTTEEELTRRLQSVAYDLRHDNLFDLELMFTHADLRAVKKDDSFHDTRIGSGRTNFQGVTRSFGMTADVYAKRIKSYVEELKKSQPILPVTKMPRASVVKRAITKVNPDGSTNIKGVYQDSDGLVIIKFNEVEDWEAIGLPKGSVSRGIGAEGENLRGSKTDVNTGNIKFFAHGLDYSNQLAKFDAFSLVDSEVLLSVSYAERPESKYRFFRTQGVLLDIPTKYVHGGGNTDAGSGCGKFISEFKRNYIFGGNRESDRLYISDMVKEATGMNDAQYIDFVKKYENKPFTEIEPIELRKKIIRAFAKINSNVRKGEREYNEMYGSNPSDVMGVFGYPEGAEVGNVMEFVHSHEKLNGFLRQYALERDIPMYIFGD